jgi:hypothetical protein
MTRGTLSSLLAVATVTVACGGSPQTTGDQAAPATAVSQEAQAPATPTETTPPPQAPAPAQSTAAGRPDVLPATASPLALIGLIGLASLGAAFGMRMRRRE